MLALYLWINAIVYGALAIWCALAWRSTSAALGFAQLDGSGRSEYLTIYGGLQLGLGILFALSALRPEWHRHGLVLALALYGGIVAFRWISIATVGPVGRNTMILAVVETALLAWAAVLWWLQPGR